MFLAVLPSTTDGTPSQHGQAVLPSWAGVKWGGGFPSAEF